MKFYKRLLAMAIVATVFISVLHLVQRHTARITMFRSWCRFPEIRKKGIQKLNTEVVQDRKFLGK